MHKTRIFNLVMVIILCLGSFGSLSAPAAAQQPEEMVVARIYYNDRARARAVVCPAGRLGGEPG